MDWNPDMHNNFSTVLFLHNGSYFRMSTPLCSYFWFLCYNNATVLVKLASSGRGKDHISKIPLLGKDAGDASNKW